MQLEYLTFPLAIKWDTDEQKDAVVAILDKKGVMQYKYAGTRFYDRIYINNFGTSTLFYTDGLSIALTDPDTTTITAEQFIMANTFDV